MEAVLCGGEMTLAWPRGRHGEFAAQPAKVTVVVPVFNGGKRLTRCLQSIADQTHKDYQVLVIDNGSTDRSLVSAMEFAEKHQNFLVYQNAKNLGRIGNWNRALDLACGQYVKPVMVNDYLLPACLEQLAEALEKNPDAVMARSSVTILDKGSWHFGPLFESSRQMTGLEAIEFGITSGNPAAGPSAQMFRRSSCVQQALQFDEGLDWAADFDFAMRLFESGGMCYLRSSLFVFELTNRFAKSAGKLCIFHDEVEVIGRAVERNFERLSPETRAKALARVETFYRNFAAEAATGEEHLMGEEMWQSAKNHFPRLFEEQYLAAATPPAPVAPSPEQAAKARSLFQSGFEETPENIALMRN